MKKLFTLVFALACFASMNAREVYLVGDATPAEWEIGRLDKTKMTEVSGDVFEWTGILFKTNYQGFKILTQRDWNPAIHPSTAGLALNEVGTDNTTYSNEDDTKWTITETALYTIHVTFEQEKVIVSCEKVGDVLDANGFLQVSSADLLEDYAFKQNKGWIDTADQKVALTADIDLNIFSTWNAIGTDSHKFIGTFDGQGHRIRNMKLDGSKKEQGFFGVIGAGATIKNLIIDTSCTITSTGGDNGQCFAAFAGCCNNNGTITFENCGNEADVTGTKQNNAAFLGCNYGATTLVFNNCYNTGKISGGWENGAFCGWCGGGATFNNCYNIGSVTEGETWARGTKSMSNCYQSVGNDNGVTKVTDEQVASGELCYKLNGDQSTIAWYQNISTGTVDAYPVPFSSHAQVYANGEMKCDGTAVAGGTLTYSNSSSSVIPDHEFENGFCKNCDKYQENAFAATDGWYIVSEPWQLRWMAVSVNEHNGTYGKANIKLTTNIDYTAYTGQTAMFGKPSNTYKGIFDGQNHTVTVAFVNTSAEETGLFRRINGGTVKNLKVAGTITTNQKLAGGICSGIWQNGTITNCESAVTITDAGSGDATHGGILAAVHDQNDIKVLSCLFSGAINASNRTGSAGIIGWTGNDTKTTVKNCLVIGEVNIKDDGNNGIIVRSNCTRDNNYYTCSKTATGFYNDNAIEASEKKGTGELCYLLNGDQSSIAWYQKLGEDQYPIPFAKEGAQVYLNATYLCPNKPEGEGTYSNTSESTIPDHSYENGYCKYCSKTDVNYLPLVDGAYEIENMYNLNWFSHIVNEGNVEANANLTADITMESDNQYGYTPIGTTEHPYVGFFNGQGHSVTLRINNPGYDYQGLFGVVTDGARIEKVVVKGFVTGKAYVGGIVGGTNGGSSNAKQTNIWYCGNEATITANGNNGAGIIGVNMNSQASIIVTSCYNTGNVTSANEGGAISGWLGGGWSSVRNCYNSGIIKNGENASKAFGRNSGCFFTNCYYTETSGTDNTSENTANGKPAMVADATLASGELAYKLIDGFYQTIGTDAYPTTEFTKPSVSYVGDAGYATMYDTTTGYTLNGDVKAYAAVLSGTRLALTEVENVPESTPVVLKGTYYNKLAADLPAINVANDLKGTDGDTAADGTMYILANGADGVGFYKAEGDIPAGKAYFQSTSGVKAFFFDGDDATGISNVDANLNANDAIYNIAGQRVQKMQKGINIINGKKVLF